jgi:hypothetical protein
VHLIVNELSVLSLLAGRRGCVSVFFEILLHSQNRFCFS